MSIWQRTRQGVTHSANWLLEWWFLLFMVAPFVVVLTAKLLGVEITGDTIQDVP